MVSATDTHVRMELEAAYRTVNVKVRMPCLSEPEPLDSCLTRPDLAAAPASHSSNAAMERQLSGSVLLGRAGTSPAAGVEISLAQCLLRAGLREDTCKDAEPRCTALHTRLT